MSLTIVAVGIAMLLVLAYVARRSQRAASSTVSAFTPAVPPLGGNELQAPARRVPPPAPNEVAAEEEVAAENGARPDGLESLAPEGAATARLAATFREVADRYKLPPLPTAV